MLVVATHIPHLSSPYRQGHSAPVEAGTPLRHHQRRFAAQRVPQAPRHSFIPGGPSHQEAAAGAP